MAAIEQNQPYIPEADLAFQAWLLNFSTMIAADPGKYGMTQADSDLIADTNRAFQDAMTAATQPATRNAGTVAEKDAQRASAEATVRPICQIIKVNQAVTNQQKINLGLHVDDGIRSVIPAPSSAPLLMIQGAFSGEHIIRYADENTPAKRAKPHQVSQIQIYHQVADGPVPLPTGATEVGLFTRQPVTVQQDPANVAKTATYFGRWVNSKGEKGPWSLPVSMTIAFGGPVDQQVPDGGTAMGGEGLSLAA